MQFDINQEEASIIKVIGVGGGGSNAVNHMYRLGIKGVDFLVCNTDAQALAISPVPFKMQLGPNLTRGRGAGAIPEVGKNAAIENVEELKSLLGNGTRMVFITAGMGGGTGTGAAPIIAGIAREMGILTIGIATIPFGFEGRKRKQQAELGIEELKKNVDALLIICNDKLREIHGNLQLRDAFGHADDILTTAAKSIAEIITNTMHLNVDFADIETVMKDSGVAIMGSANAEGDNRAVRAAEAALDSPLLNDNVIEGANYILLSITSGHNEVTMDEVGEINDYIQDQAGQTAEIILGLGHDAALGDKVSVTVIATGFKTGEQKLAEIKRPEVIIHKLDEHVAVAPIPAPPTTFNRVTEVVNNVEETPVENNDPTEPFLFIREDIGFDQHNDYSYAFTDQADMSMDPDTGMIELDFPTMEEPYIKTVQPSAPPVVEANDPPVIRHELNQDSYKNTPSAPEQKNQEDEMYQRSWDRIMRLKEAGLRHNSPSGLAEMEKEPAFKRRNVKLENTPASSDSNVSRYTLSLDDNKPEIRPNNPFLHDRVD
ncbi:MAG: cell division protein FtsZ [Bacteroidetes bacterium]|nr:cell division protein FtsZ [Bacteroidota bacterium]